MNGSYGTRIVRVRYGILNTVPTYTQLYNNSTETHQHRIKNDFKILCTVPQLEISVADLESGSFFPDPNLFPRVRTSLGGVTRKNIPKPYIASAQMLQYNLRAKTVIILYMHAGEKMLKWFLLFFVGTKLAIQDYR